MATEFYEKYFEDHFTDKIPDFLSNEKKRSGFKEIIENQKYQNTMKRLNS